MGQVKILCGQVFSFFFEFFDSTFSLRQFVHFPFSLEQVEAFKSGIGDVIVAISHANYAHMAVMAKPVRAALAGELD